MAVEAATKIADLNKLWPLGTDPRSEGDDHIRLIKQVLQATDGGALTGLVVSVKTTSGTYAKSANLKFLEVTLVGGGGGSQSSQLTAAGQSSGGAGGAGAGTCIKLYKASDLAASEAYTIGAGGVVSTDGGSTIFKGMTASGGGGAPTIALAGTTFAVGTRAIAGAATGGDINITGGDSECGMRCAQGSPTMAYAGGGGSSFFAGNQGGVYVGASAVPGIAGRFPGGGARGTGNSASQGVTAGGAVGGAGAIILREFF
jgi:hypothetical protein